MEAFTPSLNRAVLGRFDGLPPGIGGERAFDWLSSVGIAHRTHARLPDAPGPDLLEGTSAAAIIAAAPYPRLLDTLVGEGDPEALRLADDLGAALAALVATLVLGPADARAARPDWPEGHWVRWAGVRRIALGGGIVSGHLGRPMVEAATAWLPRLGAGHVAIELVPEPGALVLSGTAAGLPDGAAILVDAGHTAIKRALATIAGGRIAKMERAADLPTPVDVRGTAFRAFLADAAARVVLDRQLEGSIAAGFALAVYTDASGQPLPDQGGLYGSLAGPPLAGDLATQLEARLGRPIMARTVADGSAAARAVHGTADAAIVLGTAIGAGLDGD